MVGPRCPRFTFVILAHILIAGPSILKYTVCRIIYLVTVLTMHVCFYLTYISNLSSVQNLSSATLLPVDFG